MIMELSDFCGEISESSLGGSSSFSTDSYVFSLTSYLDCCLDLDNIRWNFSDENISMLSQSCATYFDTVFFILSQYCFQDLAIVFTASVSILFCSRILLKIVSRSITGLPW